MVDIYIPESDEFKNNFSHLSKLLQDFNIEVEFDESNNKFKTNLSFILQMQRLRKYVTFSVFTIIVVVLFAYLFNTKSDIKNTINTNIINNTISENAEVNANVDITQ